jgi:catechol 2,3-dioxygenase-like lactoylglutathione lyase family enzyme
LTGSLPSSSVNPWIVDVPAGALEQALAAAGARIILRRIDGASAPRLKDGHSRLELSRFLAPPVVADHRAAPVNALGYLRVMFTVEDIDDTLARLTGLGATLVGKVTQYQDMYRLCYIRSPEEILIGLAQELGVPRRPELTA